MSVVHTVNLVGSTTIALPPGTYYGARVTGDAANSGELVVTDVARGVIIDHVRCALDQMHGARQLAHGVPYRGSLQLAATNVGRATVWYTSSGPGILAGLAGYWRLASAGAVDLNDYALNNDLTNSGGVTRAAGPSATLPDAASFRAAFNDNLSVADVAAFAPGAAYTMGAWVRLDTGGNSTFISQFAATDGNRGPELDFLDSTDKLRFLTSTNGLAGTTVVLSSTASLSTLTWYRVFAAWDGNTVRLYINGVLDSSHAFAGPIFNSPQAFTIGTRPSGGLLSLDGRMQGVVLMPTRAITAAEVVWDYNGGQGRDWGTLL